MAPIPVILLQQFFLPKTEKRLKELQFCLKCNLSNPIVQNIYMFNEREYTISELGCSHGPYADLAKRKLQQVVIGERLGYLRAFQEMHSLQETSEQKERFYILSNTDIFFNQSLKELARYKQSALCLGRYEFAKTRRNRSRLQIKSITKSGRSQDAWIFYHTRLPNIEGPFQRKLQFYMGKPGCDNRAAQVIHEMGYKVVNPMKRIQCFHYHQTGERSYSQSEMIPGPYKYIPYQ